MDNLHSLNKTESSSSNCLNFLNSQNKHKIITLLVISLLSALSYEVLRLSLESDYIVILKTISILSIISIVYIANISDLLLKKLLIITLLSHCIGDAVIELNSNLLYSIPFFLCGNLLYSIVFIRDILNNFSLHNKTSINKIQYVSVFILVSIGFFLSYLILENLSGGIFAVILIYITVLWLACLTAVMHPSYFGIICIGMLCYAGSDFLIGYDSYDTPLYLRNVLSWPLYYLAQILIPLGLMKYSSIQRNKSI